jgi:uroporphyrinogen-III synthase
VPSSSLAGYRIVLLRAREQGAQSAALFAEHGADVVLLPTIETRAPSDEPRRAALIEAAQQHARYDWILFTSANAVRFFAEALGERDPSLRAKIACVGPETERALFRHLHTSATVVAAKHVGEGLIETLREVLVANARILLPRAGGARDLVPDALRALGHTVDVVTAYETVALGDIAERWRALGKGRDVLVFSSPSTVRAFIYALGRDAMEGAIVASIGPETTRALEARGIQVHIAAIEHSIRGVCDALLSRV